MSENETRDGGARFTPGPWSVVRWGGTDVRARGCVICEVVQSSRSVFDSDLIASAPDLYEALEQMANAARAYPGLDAYRERAEAELRMARGEG